MIRIRALVLRDLWIRSIKYLLLTWWWWWGVLLVAEERASE